MKTEVDRNPFDEKKANEACDCPLPARVIEGEELPQWEIVLEIRLAGTAPLPPGFTLLYIAMCPAWPDGCRWIEGTYIADEYVPEEVGA